jgi:hypothetical protein
MEQLARPPTCSTAILPFFLRLSHNAAPAAAASSAGWTNDHMFICPRSLCRTYFSLPTLWKSPLCTTNGSSTAPIFATEAADGSLVPGGEPTTSFSFPDTFPGTSIMPAPQWYVLARYSRDGLCGLDYRYDNASTCGLVHGFDVAYSIARPESYNTSLFFLDCNYTLTSDAWNSTDPYYPQVKQRWSECESIDIFGEVD